MNKTTHTHIRSTHKHTCKVHQNRNNPKKKCSLEPKRLLHLRRVFDFFCPLFGHIHQHSFFFSLLLLLLTCCHFGYTCRQCGSPRLNIFFAFLLFVCFFLYLLSYIFCSACCLWCALLLQLCFRQSCVY